MTDTEFDYQEILLGDNGTVSSLIAYQAPATEKFRAVLWSASRKIWMYASAIAAEILFGDEDPAATRPVDRSTAERIAVENLGSPLPSERALAAMCDEGERHGWDYGPPR